MTGADARNVGYSVDHEIGAATRQRPAPRHQELRSMMHAERTPSRKYALSRIAAGDYLLPSNDAQTIWRIARYTEGPSSGLDWPRDREVWGLWRWNGPVSESSYVDVEDWDRWEFFEGMHDIRAAAVESALRAGGMSLTYHPDPEINAEVVAEALESERADLAAGYPPRRWQCECGASHGRGHFMTIGVHRCLGCGYVGTGGVMFGTSNPTPPSERVRG